MLVDEIAKVCFALLFCLVLGRIGIASFDGCLSCLFILRNVFKAWMICHVSLSVTVRISIASQFKSNPILIWLLHRAWYCVGDDIAYGNFCADGVHHSGKIWIIKNTFASCGYVRKGLAMKFTNDVVKPVKFEGIVVRVIKREPLGRTTAVAVVVVRRDRGESNPNTSRVDTRVMSDGVVVAGRWVNVWRVGKLHRSCVV